MKIKFFNMGSGGREYSSLTFGISAYNGIATIRYESPDPTRTVQLDPEQVQKLLEVLGGKTPPPSPPKWVIE